MDRSELKVDQEVLLFNRQGRSEGKGVVTRIGRLLVDIAALDSDGTPSGWRKYTFRIEEQVSNDAWGHHRFYTPAQYAHRQKVADASKRLKDHGLETRLAGRLSEEKLVALVEFLDDYEAGEQES